MFYRSRLTRSIYLSASLLALTACSGGGDSTSNTGGAPVSGLQLPSKLSVVTAKDDSTVTTKVSGIDLNYRAVAGAMVAETTLTGFAADSNYKTDESNTWVQDRSINSLGMVNEILCLMDQTRASNMVNEGAYVALVNEEKCSQKRDNSAGASGAQTGMSTTTTQATEFKRWVVESTRTDNSSPQNVKIWIPGEAQSDHPMDGQNILVEVTINEGVSETKPFGDFVLNFTGVVDGSALEQTAGAMVKVMHGTLKTVADPSGRPTFQLIEQAGEAIGLAVPFRHEQSAAVRFADAEGNNGVAKTTSHERSECGDCAQGVWEEKSSFSVAFNPAYFLRGEDTNGDGTLNALACTDRNDFTTQTWRYNLYHTTDGTFNGRAVTAGQRVALNSGFPFTYLDDSGDKHYGHVGYWGVWMEGMSDVTAMNGQAIQKENFGDQTATETYTLKVSEGKARMREKVTAALADVAGIKFNWWNGWEIADTTLPQNQQYMVRLNAAKNGFEAYASVTWGDTGPVETALSAVVDITPQGINNDAWALWMWSEQLGGSAIYDVSGVTVPTPLVYFKETQLAAADVTTAVDLYCYERCPIGSVTAIAATVESDYYYQDSLSPWSISPPTLYTYQLSASNGVVTLIDKNGANSGKAVLAPALLPLGNEWGMGTGVMGTTIPTTGWWEMQSQATTYQWETGINSWNRAITVVDSAGVAADFDKPLRMEYQYAAGDDPNGDNFADGTPFMLEYGGAGQLWGFPWQPEDENCTDGNCRWVSALTLKDGVALSDGTQTFAVRAMEKEQQMVELLDTSSCESEGLNVTTIDLALPTSVDGSVSFLWTDRPTLTSAPAVIEGELQ